MDRELQSALKGATIDKKLIELNIENDYPQ
jgi:hypothetical protein